MRFLLYACSSAALCCLLALPDFAQNNNAQDGKPDSSKTPESRIQRYVADAKAKGVHEITIPSMPEDLNGLDSLESAGELYSLIVANVLSSQTILRMGGEIETWYVIDVLERLRTQRDIPNLVDPSLPPSLKFPTPPNQLLLYTVGGDTTVDGVLVHEPSGVGLPLKAGSTYFLVVGLLGGGKLALLANQGAALEVGDDADTLIPINPQGDFASHLRSTHRSSLSAIRNALTTIPPK